MRRMGHATPILYRLRVRYGAGMRLLALFGLTVLLAACDDGSQAITIGSLAGADWRLVRWTSDGKPVELADGSQITLAVTPEGDVSGGASVNRYRGKITLTDTGKVSWGGPGFATTRMAGPQLLMEQEGRFLAALHAVDHAALDGRTLTLSGAGHSVVLQFVR